MRLINNLPAVAICPTLAWCNWEKEKTKRIERGKEVSAQQKNKLNPHSWFIFSQRKMAKAEGKNFTQVHDGFGTKLYLDLFTYNT